MKQVSFLVEVLINEDKEPTYLLRDQRGHVVKMTKKSSEIATFFDEVVSRAVSNNTSVKVNSNE